MSKTDMSLDELRAVSDDPRFQEHIDRDERVERNRPATTPPCPSWCRLAPGHPYDSVEQDEATFIRHHESQPTGRVTVSQEERNRGGETVLTPATISIWGDRDYDETDAEGARRFAAELLTTADHLDEITGSQR